MNTSTILLGTAVFFARILDVSLGTLRIMSIVQGRRWIAFWLGFFEVAIWLTVISTLVEKISSSPILIFFYAFGFASGNMMGIFLEQRLAFGTVVLRIFSKEAINLATHLRSLGYPVTIFQGEGMKGPVMQLTIVCRRKMIPQLRTEIQTFDPDTFFTIESVGTVNKLFSPSTLPPTGWRSRFKKK